MKRLPFVLLVLIVLLFFWQIFLKGFLPIPSDTIIGLYHPFRDLYVSEYPNGIPFKNFLVTDPVRQQFPWRLLSIDVLKQLQIPLWNPYQLAGTPLLANFQSAPFYPLNIFLFVLPFQYGWTLLILLQPILASVFMFLYLRQMRVSLPAGLVGGITFAFSGFSIAWLEWNTVLHVLLWMPLLLLSIEKILSNTKAYRWYMFFTFLLAASFFAGHIQTFFYLFIVVSGYIVARIWKYKNRQKPLFLFAACYIIFLLLTLVQWLPTLKLISLSARDIDQANWQQEGWFIPWQHLIQFVAPDFFGNPTTLNYFGVWNYAEFVGYVGIFPLIMAIFSLFFRRDKKTLFFGTTFFISLLFAFPTLFAKIPFMISIPFLSTAQPTRLLSIIDFSLAVLGALGLDYFLKRKQQTILYPLLFTSFLFGGLWIFVLFAGQITPTISAENILVAKRNLVFPSMIFISIAFLVTLFFTPVKKIKHINTYLAVFLVGITVFDLFRFGWKFTPLTKQEYLFPNTKVISFLQENLGYYRYMTTDSRILPPNFSVVYKLQSIDGYDPLYLKRYAELIAASERGKSDISPPFGFNRIITPHRFDSPIIDLLGVKYVLSLSDLSSPKLKKVFQEGQTRVYENKDVAPRAFFVEGVQVVTTKEKAIQRLFDNTIDLKKIAVIESQNPITLVFLEFTMQIPFKWRADIINYRENLVTFETDSNRDAFFVFTDSYYPTWHAKIDGVETPIYRTNFNFRGIFVPEGTHAIKFSMSNLP